MRAALVTFMVLSFASSAVAAQPAVTDEPARGSEGDVRLDPVDPHAAEEPAGPAGDGETTARVAGTELDDPRPPLVFRGRGWGHGVGMSQYGAYAQARAGRSAAQILRHYYHGVELSPHTVPDPIRVGLLEGRDAILLRTASRTGETPPAGVRVRLGDHTVVVPYGDGDWAVREAADGGYEVVDPDGRVRANGSGPVVATFGDPALLRLPQLLSADASARTEEELASVGTLAATYRWGWLEIDADARADAGKALRAVLVLSLEEYLRGLAEVPSSWGTRGGVAALEAQAIAGRTYASRRMTVAWRGEACGCHLGATPAHQVYAGWAKEGEPGYGRHWRDAVEATAGQVVTYQGQLASTFYSSSHGGRSEHVEDSWAYGSAVVPYLRSVDDRWSLDPDVGNPLAAWETAVSNRAFADWVATDQRVGVGFHRVTGVQILDRTAGGSPRTLEVSGVDTEGRDVTARVAGTTKDIAGASLLRDLRTAGGTRLLPSQQLVSIGFPPFRDDDGSVHELSIYALHTADIVRGVSDTRFAPQREVTRGQMASLLAAALDLPAAGDQGFADVAGTTHEAGVNAVVEAGIAAGVSAREFRPHDPVTRGQMASLLAAALDLPAAGDQGFADVAGTTHEAGVNAVVAAGVARGVTEAAYRPGAAVTRGQMATFLHQALRGHR